MATKYFTGEATAFPQIWSGSFDSVDATPANNTFTVTIGGVAISQVGTTDVATTAAALRGLLNGTTHPYFAAITWSGSGGNIVGTADVAGAPFIAALTETGAGTGTVTDFAETLASSGPNHWDDASNYSDGVVPVNTDTVIVEGIAVNICWGIEQTGVTLANLEFRGTYEGKVGLDLRAFATSADGDTAAAIVVPEYRADYLNIGYDRADIGQHIGPGVGGGSSRIKLRNAKAGASTTVVHGTASGPSEAGFPAVRLLAAHASADVVVRGSRAGVGIGMDEPGETATVGALKVSGGALFVGPGVTWTSLQQSAGASVVQAAATVTSIEIDDGTVRTEGDFTVTTVEGNGGTLFQNHIKSAGNAIGTLNMNGARIDTSQNLEARTFNVVNPNEGTLIRDSSIVTITTMNAPVGPREMVVR